MNDNTLRQEDLIEKNPEEVDLSEILQEAWAFDVIDSVNEACDVVEFAEKIKSKKWNNFDLDSHMKDIDAMFWASKEDFAMTQKWRLEKPRNILKPDDEKLIPYYEQMVQDWFEKIFTNEYFDKYFWGEAWEAYIVSLNWSRYMVDDFILSSIKESGEDFCYSKVVAIKNAWWDINYQIWKIEINEIAQELIEAESAKLTKVNIETPENWTSMELLEKFFPVDEEKYNELITSVKEFAGNEDKTFYRVLLSSWNFEFVNEIPLRMTCHYNKVWVYNENGEIQVELGKVKWNRIGIWPRWGSDEAFDISVFKPGWKRQ